MLPDLPRPINGHILSMLPSSSALAVACSCSEMLDVLLDRESGALSFSAMSVEVSSCDKAGCSSPIRFFRCLHTSGSSNTFSLRLCPSRWCFMGEYRTQFLIRLCVFCLLTDAFFVFQFCAGVAIFELRLDTTLHLFLCRREHMTLTNEGIEFFFKTVDKFPHFISFCPLGRDLFTGPTGVVHADQMSPIRLSRFCFFFFCYVV